MPKKNPHSIQSNDVLHYTWLDLLPSEHTLALNKTFGTLMLLTIREGLPYLIREAQFSDTEVSVLLPLFEMYPSYCPYEVLYASFTYGTTGEMQVQRCLEHLQEAQREGIWDQEMRPIRNVISRARLKLHDLGMLDIASVADTGYWLKSSKTSFHLRNSSASFPEEGIEA